MPIMLKSVALVVTFSLFGSSWGSTMVGPGPTQIKNLVTFGDSYTDVVSVYLTRIVDDTH